MSRPVGGQGSSFPAASNVLQRKWNQRTYQMHVAKKNGMKTKVDATSPKIYPHLQVNMKKMQVEEERQALIDHENRILLAKLTNIIRSGGQLDNWNFEHETGPKTLHAPHRNREQERIERENAALLKRLNNIKPSVNFDKMEDDYLMHNYFLAQKAQTTRNFEVDVRGVDDGEKFVFYAKDRHAQKEKTFVEGDIEETIDEPAEGEPLELSSNKPPDLVGQKTHPPRQQLKRRATKLPVLGAERKKAEEKKKKDAAVKPPMYNQKDEAAKLFKATKGMGNPEQILVQTLAKRTYQQRQDTLKKFEENYGLTLEQELKNNLSAEYDDIVDCLLVTREDFDALTLRRALKGEDSLVEPIIEILCTRSNAAISGIKEAYQTKYGVSLENDITAEIKGKLKHLFLALTKGCRMEDGEVDPGAAQRDAEALRDAGSDERWNPRSGKMCELLQEASLPHFREVLIKYNELMSSNFEKELSRMLLGDFKDAMICLVRCMNSCPDFLAERLHAALTGEADEMTLIRIIITRSELDLPLIRRSYKRQYRQTLVESMQQRCQASFRSALVQMVVVHGAPQKTEQTNEPSVTGEDSSKADGPAKSYGQPKALKKPAPNPSAKVPSNNPLLKSTLQPTDQARKPSGNAQRASQNGARAKQPSHGPGSPVKSRQAGAPVRGREAISPGNKKTLTPPRKSSPGVVKTPAKVTPKDTAKPTRQPSDRLSAGKSGKGHVSTENVKKEEKEIEMDKIAKEVVFVESGGAEKTIEKDEKIANEGETAEEQSSAAEEKQSGLEDGLGKDSEEQGGGGGVGDAEMKSLSGSEKGEGEVGPGASTITESEGQKVTEDGTESQTGGEKKDTGNDGETVTPNLGATDLQT